MGVQGDSIGSVVIRFLADPEGFNRALDQMGAGIQQLSGRLTVSATAIAATFDKVGSTLTTIGSSVNRAASAIGEIGTKAGVAAAALSAPFAVGIKTLMDFDKEFAQVVTLFGTKPPAQNIIDGLREGVKQLSQDMGISLNDAVRGLYQAISAGVPPENAISFLETSTKASIAGATDLFTAVDVLTTAINAYGNENLTAEHASDVLFQTVNFGKTEFQDLAGTMGRVIPLAAQFKIPLEQIGGALGAMTRQGLSTEMAVTSLRQMFVSFLQPTKDVQDQIDALNKAIPGLNLQFNAATLETEGLTGMMAKIQKVIDYDKQAFKNLFPEVNAFNGAASLGAQNGKVFAEALASMNDATGIADNGFKIMKETLSHTFDELKSKLMVALMELAQQIMPDVTKKMGEFSTSLKDMSQWIKENPDKFHLWANRIWEVVKALAEVWIASKVLKFVLELFGGLLTGAGLVTKGIGKIVEAFGWLKNAVVGTAAASEAMRKGFSTLGGAGTEAMKNLTGTQRVVGSLIAAITNASKTAWEFLTRMRSFSELGPILSRLPTLLSGFGTAIMAVARGAIPFLVAQISGIATAVAGVVTLTTAGFAVIAAGVVAIGYSYFKYRQSVQQLNETLERGVDIADKARAKYKLQDQALTDLRAAIGKATDAEEKRIAQENYAEAVSVRVATMSQQRNAQLNRQIEEAIDAQGRMQNSLVVSDSAWMIAKETGVDAATAVKMATLALTDAQVTDAPRGSAAVTDATERAIDMYKKMSETERQGLKNFVDIGNERAKYNAMSAQQQQAFFEDALKRNDFLNAKDRERTEALLLFKQHEISMDGAVIAAKRNFTAQEIALLEQGVSAEEIATQRKQQSRKDDTAALAEKLGQDSANIEKFVNEMNNRILELVKKRDEMIQAARDIIKDDPQKYMQMMDNARAFNTEIITLTNQRDAIANQSLANYAENVAKEMELDYKRSESQLTADEIDKKALENRKERLGDNFKTVIDSLGQYKSVYEGLSADQKAAADQFAVNLLENRLAVDSSAEGTRAAYATTTQALRVFLTQMTNENAAAGEKAILVMQTHADTASKTAPTVTASYQTITAAVRANRVENAQLAADLSTTQQMMKNMAASGMDNSAAYTELISKSHNLQEQLKANETAFNSLTASTRGNRAEMIETSNAVVRQINETEQLIIQKRAEGESTDALQVKLNTLNAQYDILSQQMKAAGVEMPQLNASMGQASGATQDLGTKVTATAGTFTDLNKNVDDTSKKLAVDLPAAAQQGATQTQNIFERTWASLKDSLWSLWEDMKYVFDFSQTGSPSMNDYIEQGLGQTYNIYASSMADMMKLFIQTHKEELDLLMKFGADYHLNQNGTLDIIKAPKGVSAPFLGMFENLKAQYEKLNQQSIDAGKGPLPMFEMWLKQMMGLMPAAQKSQDEYSNSVQQTDTEVRRVTVTMAGFTSSLQTMHAQLRDMSDLVSGRVSSRVNGGNRAGIPRMAAMPDSAAIAGMVGTTFGIRSTSGATTLKTNATAELAATIPLGEQDVFAEKVGKAVASALSPRGLGIAGLPMRKPPVDEPLIQSSVSREFGGLNDRNRQLRDAENKKDRRTYY